MRRGSIEDSTEKRLKAWELRKDGKTEAEIAAQIGVSQVMVSKYLRKTANELKALTLETAEQQRTLDLARIDTAIEAIEWKVKQGDTKAIKCLVDLLAERAKLLGTYMPAKQELTGKDGADLFKGLADALITVSSINEPDRTSESTP